MKKNFLSLISHLLMVCLFVATLPAQASMIGTQDVLAEQSLAADRAKIDDFLARDNVQQALQSMDVAPDLARQRVDAMTPAEIASLSQRIDSMPVAGALSGTDFVIILLVAILVVLIL
ncbi:PA2779 family protein [Ectopseudomonas hydrolytica]|uniref:PA2779 family protein n=1 Tax=Ectopseudomonas hydrolytica TaxID=2493633 RepID=UPI003EE1F35A